MTPDHPMSDHLAPPPRQARLTDARWRPASTGPFPLGLVEEAIGGSFAGLAGLGRELERLGLAATRETPGDGPLRLHRRAGLGDEGYELRVGPDGVDLAFETSTGAFRGFTTLGQWLRLHPNASRDGASSGIAGVEIHGIEIHDRPSFPVRGLLLDVSRNRVPTLAELEATVDLLAELKYNQLQLYTEHTFAYAGHETAWRGWSPLTAEEITHLARYARERHVEWVPNQNSFGHMHRWLVHEPYRALAECPEGIEHPFSLEREPFSLCPTDPAALDLLDDLYAQLLPLSDGTLFNANLDETLDLGLGRSKEACERLGKERVYLDFVDRVHERARVHGKRLMMWGDVVLEHPDSIPRLPEDAVILEWGYEADHPFDRDCARFAASGRDFYVCPGTSAWSTFSGRTENALANLSSAAVHGRRHGAAGYLVTDWGDHGHLQPPIVGQVGWLVGACFGWNADDAERPRESPDEPPWAERLDRHLLGDRHRPRKDQSAGRSLLDLGRVQDATGVRPLNGSPFFFAVMRAHLPPHERRTAGLSSESIDASLAELDAVLHGFARAELDRADAPLLRHELDWVGQALRFGARLARERLRAGEERPLHELPADVRRSLVRELDELADALRPPWLERSRPGGLDASIQRLTAIRPALVR